MSKPVAVMSCEGACLRGEVARRAANILCHSLAPEKTARICLGSAFTKDTGQRALVRNAPRVIALEGCAINCSSRMMAGAIDGLVITSYSIHYTKLYECLVFWDCRYKAYSTQKVFWWFSNSSVPTAHD